MARTAAGAALPERVRRRAETVGAEQQQLCERRGNISEGAVRARSEGIYE